MHSKKVILYFKTSQVQRKSADNVSRGKQASVGEKVLVTSVGVNKRQWGKRSAGKSRQVSVGVSMLQQVMQVPIEVKRNV